MKVSLITVCYNSERTIEDTLKSISGQTYKDIEYIVIDGGSTDSTCSIIEKYSSHIAIYKSEKDKGLYDAMNKGVLLATGDIVGILNSDDVYENENVISEVVDNFSADVDAVFSDLVIVDKDNLDRVERYYSSSYFSKKLIRFGLMLPHPTFFVRKKYYNELGLYDTSLPVAADFDLILRFVMSGLKLKRINNVLVRMRNGGKSNGGIASRVKQNIEVMEACRKNNIYTNLLFISLKVPFKLSSFFFSKRKLR